MKTNDSAKWTALPYTEWKETRDTLHLWTQIVGKVKLEFAPFLNHYWEVVFYLTPVGLTTGRIPYEHKVFEVAFNFINHSLIISTNEGEIKTIHLRPQSVADFYQEFMQVLAELGIKVSIAPTPSEIIKPIPFEEDSIHKSYDKEYVARWHQIQLQIGLVMDRFRSSFRGKASPVQFFWGSFDLSYTRFSGKKLPDKTDWPEGYGFMRYAENEENFACGFWPGDQRYPQAAFYAYMYPAPEGYEKIELEPKEAFFSEKLSEYLLPYEDVWMGDHPEKLITDFFESAYRETAKLSGWDIESLEGLIPKKLKK